MRPMPSPNHTNHARLFLSDAFPISNPTMALDAAWQAPAQPPSLNARAEQPKTEAHRTAMGFGGIPERGWAFLATRLLPADLDQLKEVLKRAASSRPMGGSSLHAMDQRKPDGQVYVSTMHGTFIGKDGRTTRWARARDLRAAEKELNDFISGAR